MKNTTHKDTVLAFLKQVVSGRIREAYDAYIHPDFRHHNVYYKGDRESLMQGMEESHIKFPTKKFDVKKVIEDGDTIATFSSISLTGLREISVVHIFRFQDGKIIEMWDTGQEIPEDCPNENGAF